MVELSKKTLIYIIIFILIITILSISSVLSINNDDDTENKTIVEEIVSITYPYVNGYASPYAIAIIIEQVPGKTIDQDFVEFEEIIISDQENKFITPTKIYNIKKGQKYYDYWSVRTATEPFYIITFKPSIINNITIINGKLNYYNLNILYNDKQYIDMTYVSKLTNNSLQTYTINNK